MSNYSMITLSELQKLSHKNQVRFALFCAKTVSHLNLNHETQLAIKTVELWLDNKATAEECEKAADAAYADADATDAARAATDAAYAAGYAAYADADAAAYAARAATDAAYAVARAARNKAIQAQREHYNELLHIDRIFEKVALGYT